MLSQSVNDVNAITAAAEAKHHHSLNHNQLSNHCRIQQLKLGSPSLSSRLVFAGGGGGFMSWSLNFEV